MIKLMLALAALAFTTAARADTFTYNSFTVDPGLPVTITDPSVGVSGQFKFGSITLQGSGPNAGQSLLAWCVDIITTLNTSGVYNIVPFPGPGSVGNGNPVISATQVNEMASLILNEHNPLDNNPGATQLAIWKLEYGSGITFSSLNSIVDADILLATTLAADAAPGGSLNVPGAELNLLDVVPTNQILATAIVGQTPLPPALTLFGGGLALIGGLGLRRKKEPRSV